MKLPVVIVRALAETLGTTLSLMLSSFPLFTISPVMCTLSYSHLLTCRLLLCLVILWQVRKRPRTFTRPSRLTRRKQGHSLETFSKCLLYGTHMHTHTHTQLHAHPYPPCSVTVRSYGGTYRYTIYEVWQDDECLQRLVTRFFQIDKWYDITVMLVLCVQALFLKAE